MTKITSYIRSLFSALKLKISRHPRKALLVGIVVLAILAFMFFGKENAQAPIKEERTPSVTVASVASLSRDGDSLVLLGEVRSVSQADLRAQKPGEVTRVYVTAGQNVKAGAILAEISNASERAAVLSAQGMLDAANAQLQKIQTGARGEDKASSVVQAQATLIALQSAKNSARSAYSQSYSLAQDAVFAQADSFFSNAYTVDPSFRVTTATYDERQVLEAERVALGDVLAVWKQKTTATIPDDQLDTRLAEADRDLMRIKSFLNQIGGYISEQKIDTDLTSATKASQQGVILGAQSGVDAARNAVNGARTGLAGALSSAQVASLNESKIITGERTEDVSAVEAGVTQARGALASAYAALENTLIRTPISGVVSTLTVTPGDYVSAMQTVAVVANEGALEVEAYVSGQARERITVGDKVLVDGRFEGTVTSAAPGLDPVTKKARITVGLSGEASLVNGSFVEVMILGSTTDVEALPTELSVPISAIKVLPRGFVVFTVNQDSLLEPHPIVEGPIVGNKMIVSEGVTPELRIVTDVRGLSEGDRVEVATTDEN